MANSFIKDSTSVLDYKFNWSSWLTTADSISTYAIDVPTGLTESTSSFNSTSVTVWLSGGEVGKTYSVGCRIETASSRTDKRSINMHIRNR